MVCETRDIIFDKAELLCAAESHHRATPGCFPPGKIASCAVNSDGTVTVGIESMGSGSSVIKNYQLKEVDLLRLLTRFCLENNIVLPRQGQKSAVVRQDSVALNIKLEINGEA